MQHAKIKCYAQQKLRSHLKLSGKALFLEKWEPEMSENVTSKT